MHIERIQIILKVNYSTEIFHSSFAELVAKYKNRTFGPPPGPVTGEEGQLASTFQSNVTSLSFTDELTRILPLANISVLTVKLKPLLNGGSRFFISWPSTNTFPVKNKIKHVLNTCFRFRIFKRTGLHSIKLCDWLNTP